MELLAPAGSREALTAAVEAGADAVYLAGSKFGARAYAANFDESGLREAVAFAHGRRVRVHVAVNTIVAADELRELAEYLRFLYDIGADAVLLQDLGAAYLARQVVPDMPLHASTQMTVTNLAAVRMLEELGFSRIVLARELSLAEIKHICREAKAEIEVFVHGALCVCYSGQCLMSSLIGARSGNRGGCAQPCRLPYTLVDESGNDLLGDKAGKFLLSPKDLAAIDLLPELMAAGVASLKIEGRMKRAEYVAIVTDSYRRGIDAVGRGEHAATEERKNRLAQIFNRDFTRAYLENKPGQGLMSDRRPNNRGLFVGRVTAYDREKRRVTLKLDAALAVGDQLDFWVKTGGRVSATVTELADVSGRSVRRVERGMLAVFSLPQAVHAKTRAFKVYDAALMTEARGFFTAGILRRVPVRMRVQGAVGEPLTVIMDDDDGHSVRVTGTVRGEAAKNRPLTYDVITKQMSRLGTTVYRLDELAADIQGGVMVPVSELNNLRREAVAALDRERQKAFARPEKPTVNLPAILNPAVQAKSSAKKSGRLIAVVDDAAKAKAALDAGADGLLFGGESYGGRKIRAADYKAACELARSRGRLIIFGTPRIIREWMEPELSNLWRTWQGLEPDAIDVHSLGTMELLRPLTDRPFISDFSLPAYNHLTLWQLAELGVRGAVLSPELTLAQVGEIVRRSPIALACIVHGRLPMMVTEHCVLGCFLGGRGEGSCRRPCQKGKKYFLRDRKDKLFPLVQDEFCHQHILNSQGLSMLPYAGEMAAMGLDLRLECRHASPKETAAAVSAYSSALRGKGVLPSEGEDFTRGHYFRGVKKLAGKT